MTAFNRKLFDLGSGNERWVTYGPERRFVARFKYHRAGYAAHFVDFLAKHFEVEEYFELLHQGISPLIALEAKGYVSPNMARAQAECARQGITLREYILGRSVA